uniref:Uncharacterized protein n=1 Tax=Knipowitschia caucasica TaxID=637954 RepID=A0AAV2LZ44_KNICA
MKPWYLYTLEEDQHLYDQEFDLEALLNPTPSRPGVQTHSTPPSEPGVQTHSTPDEGPLVLTPPEEAAPVTQLRQQLQRARTQLRDQKRVIREKDSAQLKQELTNTKRVLRETPQKEQDTADTRVTLQKKDKQLEEHIKALKETRLLYNTAVTDKVTLKQELINTKRVLRETQEKVREQDIMIAEMREVSVPVSYSKSRGSTLDKETSWTSAQKRTTERPCAETAPGETMKLNQGLSRKDQELEYQAQVTQSLESKLKIQEGLIDEKDSELKTVKVTLQKKEKELEEHIKALKEIRLLYNTAVMDKVTLKQELSNSKRLSRTTALDVPKQNQLSQTEKQLYSELQSIQREVNCLNSKNKDLEFSVKQHEDQRSQQKRLSITDKNKWASRRHY